MPIPTILCIALASGAAAAWGGRAELRLSPRPILFTRSFAAYASFAALLLLPVSIYFYVFHGDWFLLYVLDVSKVPSAIAMLGFVGEFALGAAGFFAGSTFVRTQRDGLALVLSAGALALGVLAPMVLWGRLSHVGTFAQHRGNFGLQPFAYGPLMQGAVVMTVLLSGGFVYLLARLHMHGRRGS